jgi:hypothetical protein
VELVEFLLENKADPWPHKRSPGAMDPSHPDYRIDPILAPKAILVQPGVDDELKPNAAEIVALLNEYRAKPEWAF